MYWEGNLEMNCSELHRTGNWTRSQMNVLLSDLLWLKKSWPIYCGIVCSAQKSTLELPRLIWEDFQKILINNNSKKSVCFIISFLESHSQKPSTHMLVGQQKVETLCLKAFSSHLCVLYNSWHLLPVVVNQSILLMEW